MSFGALSREAKIALARGTAEAGTLICSGDSDAQMCTRVHCRDAGSLNQCQLPPGRTTIRLQNAEIDPGGHPPTGLVDTPPHGKVVAGASFAGEHGVHLSPATVVHTQSDPASSRQRPTG